MPLKLEIFLPLEKLTSVDEIQDYIIDVGDLTAKSFGNAVPEDIFDLKELKSFIIISESELPDSENLGTADTYFVIPIEETDE